MTLDNENFISACNKIKNNSNSDQVILSGIHFEKEWYQVPSKMERHRKFECSDKIAILISEIETSIKMRLTDEQRKFILKKKHEKLSNKEIERLFSKKWGERACPHRNTILNIAKTFSERGSILDKTPKRKSFPSVQKLAEIREHLETYKHLLTLHFDNRIISRNFGIL